MSSSSGATLRSSAVYGLMMGKLSVMPPVRTTDQTPLMLVDASCPSETVPVNWIFLQAPATRAGDYFWGRSTMTPTSTTMTRFFNVDGVEGFNGRYTLPVTACTAGVFDFAGSVDFQAKMYSTDNWTGFYKTAPGNSSFYAPIWTIVPSLLGNSTYVGLTFVSQDADTSANVKVTSNGAGNVFTIRPYADPESDTLATGSSSYTETLTITAVNSPLPGMMRGTLSRVDDQSAPLGSTVPFGCIVADTGAGGFSIGCGGQHPLNSTNYYSLVFNYKPTAGSVDFTFAGTGGIMDDYFGSTEIDRAIAIQSDGKILTGGTTYKAGAREVAVKRFLPDGTADGKWSYPIGVGESQALAIAVQSDGKILVAGQFQFSAPTNEAFVARLTTDGLLDSSFGSGGIARPLMADASTTSTAGAIALQSDGKILIGVDATRSSVRQFAVARFRTDGSLDTAFNSNGKASVVVGTSAITNAIALQADGKILVGGPATIGGQLDFGLVRFNAGGSLDTTFGSAGIVTKDINSLSRSDQLLALAVQSDGKILAGGQHSGVGTNLDTVVVRYNSDGSLDTSFDSDGVAVNSLGTTLDYITGLAIQSDGKIVASGRTLTSALVMRFNASNGSLDATWDSDGVSYPSFGSGASAAWAIAIQRDGKIVTSGTATNANTDSLVMRLWP